MKNNMFKHASDYISFCNKKYGNLRTLYTIERINKKWSIACICDCGNTKFIRVDHLASGRVKSCGYKCPLVLSGHGLSNTQFYNSFDGMRHRCLNIKSLKYKDYGGRGIKVCDRWLGKEGFIHFKEDMYESYLEHIEEFGKDNTSLDRIDVNGNYEPFNVRWATRSVQQRNRRNSPITENYDEHSRVKCLAYNAVSSSLRKGYCVNNIFFMRYLGISFEGLKQYLELKFLPGMTWKNRGNNIGNWNVDHIIPCNQFDLSNEEDKLKCLNYKNLQPLWVFDHSRKIVYSH